MQNVEEVYKWVEMIPDLMKRHSGKDIDKK